MRSLMVAALVAAMALAFFPTASVGSEPVKADRPVWQVGDSWAWKFEKEVGGRKETPVEFTDKVIRVGEFNKVPTYFLESGGEVLVYDMDLNLIAVLDKAGKPTSSRRDVRYVSWPLAIGSAWEADGKEFVGSRVSTAKIAGKVEAVEDIEVPAGAFRGFKVTTKWDIAHFDGRRFTQSIVYWWAPADVGNIVSSIRTRPAERLMIRLSLVRYQRANAR